jgi:hypothetical protein
MANPEGDVRQHHGHESRRHRRHCWRMRSGSPVAGAAEVGAVIRAQAGPD